MRTVRPPEQRYGVSRTLAIATATPARAEIRKFPVGARGSAEATPPRPPGFPRDSAEAASRGGKVGGGQRGSLLCLVAVGPVLWIPAELSPSTRRFPHTAPPYFQSTA